MDGVSADELQPAHRNAAMPLEALRLPITPLGLHYLLIHYDIPEVDASAWRLEIGGCVERPLTLSFDELRAREHVAMPVTMECAGNGRARMDPRPVSQPWLGEAIGTARWTGTPLAPLLREAGLTADAVDVVFTGLDRGVEGGVPQAYERSLTTDEALGSDALLAWGIGDDVPLPPQHGFPLRLVVPGWYGMTNVKWLHRITVVDRPFEGYQQARGYRLRTSEDDPGTPVTRMLPRALMQPPGVPDFMTRRRFVSAGPSRLDGRAGLHGAPALRQRRGVPARRPRVVGLRGDHPRRGQHGRRAQLGRRRARRRARPARVPRVGLCLGCAGARRARAAVPRDRRGG